MHFGGVTTHAGDAAPARAVRVLAPRQWLELAIVSVGGGVAMLQAWAWLADQPALPEPLAAVLAAPTLQLSWALLP